MAEYPNFIAASTINPFLHPTSKIEKSSMFSEHSPHNLSKFGIRFNHLPSSINPPYPHDRSPS